MPTPQFLRLLRIEDQRAKSPNLPLQDLGRVGRWRDFVLGIASGCIRTVQFDKSTTDYPLEDLPDILTVDFRFNADNTTPDPAVKLHPPGITFSEGLKERNNGVVIGSYLMSLAGQKDMPTLTALHTMFPADTQRDGVTTLLVGQMLAATGRHFSEDEHPLEAAYRYFDKLPKNLEEAVVSSIGEYRISLLTRLGSTIDDKVRKLVGGERAHQIDDRRLRLFCAPGTGLELKSRIAAATSDEELDRILSKHGLKVWDRFGRDHCIDLRSLFLDYLDPSQLKDCTDKELQERIWGLLPRSLFAAGAAGDQFLSLVENADSVYAQAAEFVRYNRLNDPKRSLSRRHSPLLKFMAMIFAYEEIRQRSIWEIADDLQVHWWDAESDRIVKKSEFEVTLQELLETVIAVVDNVPKLFPNEDRSNDEWLPLTGRDGPSIAKAIHKYFQVNKAADRKTDIIQEVFYQGNANSPEEFHVSRQDDVDEDSGVGELSAKSRRSKALRNLVNKLVTIGVFEERRIQGKLWYRRIPNTDLRVEDVSRIDRIQVAKLLGYNPQIRDGHEVLNHQLTNICQNVGYNDTYLSLLDRLDQCDFPPHLMKAVQWYRDSHFE